MKKPKAIRMYELAERVYMMHRALGDKDKVKMLNPRVCIDEETLCGTPCCFAGWYTFFAEEGPGYFESGVRKIEEFLYPSGSLSYSFEMWAKENPHIWGNTNGGMIFCGSDAFLPDDDPINERRITLKDISDHLYKVAWRLYAIETSQDANDLLGESGL